MVASNSMLRCFFNVCWCVTVHIKWFWFMSFLTLKKKVFTVKIVIVVWSMLFVKMFCSLNTVLLYFLKNYSIKGMAWFASTVSASKPATKDSWTEFYRTELWGCPQWSCHRTRVQCVPRHTWHPLGRRATGRHKEGA